MRLKLDKTALLQGVGDARDADHISRELAQQIYSATARLQYPGPTRRPVVDYDRWLVAMSQIAPIDTANERDYHEMARLWEHLGKYVYRALGVAESSEATARRCRGTE